MMYDKDVVTPRLCAWYGERPIRENDVRTPRPMIPELESLRQRIMTATGTRFDGVLLNYYRDGTWTGKQIHLGRAKDRDLKDRFYNESMQFQAVTSMGEVAFMSQKVERTSLWERVLKLLSG